ncbi:MAG: bifunctional metallophosphatase/5'-nucleotidase, partial [Spirochaetes bacterium]|nr:bifunctional metallophosphatase/5'-nucleotidase [Spirochaetota bacterium]
MKNRHTLRSILVIAAILPNLYEGAARDARPPRIPLSVHVSPVTSSARHGGDSGEAKVTILFFNDLHGQLLPYRAKGADGKTAEVGGIAGLAAMVKAIRRENGARGIRTILLVAGDLLQGTPLSTVFHGRADMEILNAMGVDAMVMGNHELDFGIDNFLILRRMARFPIISANVAWKKTGKLMNPPTARFRLKGPLMLTVIGVTTQELLTTTAPANVGKVDVLVAAGALTPLIRRASRVGPVVLLSHSRYRSDAEMACGHPVLAAVIGGHDHILLDPPRSSCGVSIFQAHEKGRYLGRIDLAVDGKTGKARIEKHSYLPVTPAALQDAAVARIIASYRSKLNAALHQEIGQSLVFMGGERGRIRFEETNLGNFVADAMREKALSDMAFINAGSLRASIEKGPITIESVFRVMPYSNELMTVTLTGGEIMEALDRSVRGTREDEDGGFLHVSGITFAVRGRKAAEIRIFPGGAPVVA